MDIINLMLWVLYLTSTFITFGVIFQTSVNSSVLYIVSAIAIFLAWFNCLLYFQRFNTSGIYVVMFFEILLTLVRVLIVFCVLIIAFSLSFYILLTKVCFEKADGFWKISNYQNTFSIPKNSSNKRKASTASRCPSFE